MCLTKVAHMVDYPLDPPPGFGKRLVASGALFGIRGIAAATAIQSGMPHMMGSVDGGADAWALDRFCTDATGNSAAAAYPPGTKERGAPFPPSPREVSRLAQAGQWRPLQGIR